MSNNLFDLLRQKEIISILIGDTDFGHTDKYGIDDFKLSLPYLKGPDLCDLSCEFGLPVSYPWGGGALSRKQYMDDLLAHCIKHNTVSNLLLRLFSKGQFVSSLKMMTPQAIDTAYKEIVLLAIQHINGILYFGNNELIYDGVSYVIKPIRQKVSLQTPSIKAVDRQYIIDISSRAMACVENGDFESAITKSRTLLEEVFIFAINKKGETANDDGDITKLFKKTRELYNMHTDKDADRRINKLISGLNSIVDSIAEMRNKNSDAHGAGTRRISIEQHHARLLVNSAMTLADFILSVANR